MSNPFINLLLSRYDSGGGAQFAGNGMDDFKGLVDAYAAYKKAAGPDETKKEDSPKVAPLDRIKAAFEDLKNMHKTDFPSANDASASPLDTAQWPQGPVGAPTGAMAQALAPTQAPATPMQAPASVPMPQPRPAEADASQPALMSFFQRNAALMRDPSTGDYIDPTGAAKASAQPGIFSHLFG